eukprot:Sspe_Gene.25621::Locus_10333_Transcript_1_2_Confidence_0.500_Length_5282::g.25621::m.25621
MRREDTQGKAPGGREEGRGKEGYAHRPHVAMPFPKNRDLVAFNRFYDTDEGLAATSSTRAPVGASVARSKLSYRSGFGPGKAGRLEFPVLHPDVGPGKYDLSGQDISGRAGRAGKSQSHFYRSAKPRFRREPWSVPKDVVGMGRDPIRRTFESPASFHDSQTTKPLAMQDVPLQYDGCRRGDVAERVSKLPYGRIGTREPREFNLYSWAVGDPRCRTPPIPKDGEARLFALDPKKHLSIASIATKARTPSPTDLNTSFGSRGDRVLDTYSGKRPVDIVPQDYFILKHDMLHTQ